MHCDIQSLIERCHNISEHGPADGKHRNKKQTNHLIKLVNQTPFQVLNSHFVLPPKKTLKLCGSHDMKREPTDF